MERDEIKKKTSRSIKIKANINQNNEDKTQNKYKVEDTIKFVKAWHEYQGSGEKNEGQEKKTHHCRTAACLAKRTTPTVVPQPCTLDKTKLGIFIHRNFPRAPLE